MTSPTLAPAFLVTTAESLARTVGELRAASCFALDTESNSLYAYHYRVCLIQASTPGADYLIDTLALPDQSLLADLVAEPGIEVTIHAAENDVLLLNHDFGFRFEKLFDTLWAARILGWPQVGLAAILQETFGVQVEKRLQRTDWGRRPLTPEQLRYGQIDTHYLLPLAEQQTAELKACDRWKEAQEVFAEITGIVWEGKETPGIWRLSGVWDMEPRQQAVLKALFDWREATASQRNVPPFKVLSNDALLALSFGQPETTTQLRAVPSLPRSLSEGVERAILRAVHEGKRQPPPQPPERNHGRPPSPEVVARYDRLRAWRRRTAEARGVEPDVVMTNQVLMGIARAHPRDLAELEATHLLGPWRLQTYGPTILHSYT